MTDPKQFLETQGVESDLKRIAVRGGTVTLAAQVCKFILGIGATMVLARLLTPSDFGLVAMVAAFTGFVSMFKDMGLSMATVQRNRITHDQVSTLFWVNVSISSVLLLAVAALSPAVAWFYDEPRLLGVTIVLGGAFVFGGLTVQHHAVLRRQMRFVSLAWIEIAALLAGIGVAIMLALLLPPRHGYWALALRPVAVALAMMIGVWVACRWRPSAPRRGAGVRSLLAFGGHLTGFSVVNYFGRNADKALIGLRWQEAQLGLYVKAYQLLLLPIQQINAPIASVAVPTLSRLQDDPKRYRRYYLRAMNLIAFVTTPLIVTMVALSDEVIAIVLGDQWLGAGRIFRILALGALGQPISSANGWLFISQGRTKRMFIWGLISAPLFVIGFVIGLRWGAMGVAASYAVVATLLRYPGFLFAFHNSPIGLRDLVAATWRPTAASILLLGVLLAVREFLAPADPVACLAICAPAGILTLLAAFFLWPGMRREVARLWETAQMLRPRPPVRAESGVYLPPEDSSGHE